MGQTTCRPMDAASDARKGKRAKRKVALTGDIWIDLNNMIDGEVILPTDSLFPSLITQWNAEKNNVTPKAVIMAESAEDVSTALTQTLIPNNLPFTVRSAPLGGHLWSGYSVADDAVVLDVSRMNTLSVDFNDDVPVTTTSEINDDGDDEKKVPVNPNTRTVSLGPGVSQGWANQALEPYFCAFPTSGDCPQFAFGGFFGGGGLSLFLRSEGIGADFVEQATVVLTDGRIVTAARGTEYEDLLWAIKGGGAGNMGIITNYSLRTFAARPQGVLSLEVYWQLPTEKAKLVQFLKTWTESQSGQKNTAFTSWLVLLPGKPYTFRMLGIWNGDIDEGRLFWEQYVKDCGVEPITETTNVGVLSVRSAVALHQSTFAGDSFRGVIDARTVKQAWSEAILEGIADLMLAGVAEQEAGSSLQYIWLLVCYGGAMLTNDPRNEQTSFGHRDAVGDITILMPFEDDAKQRDAATAKLGEIQGGFLDKISPYYYPNHPSTDDIQNVKVAFYDHDHKPWLYEKLQQIKNKYDPQNVLKNPVTIPPQE